MSAPGDWPRTGRLLPWLCAIFLGFIWLVPSEAITLPISLGIDAHPDRFLLAGIVVVAFASVVASRRHAPSTPAIGLSLAFLGFATVAFLSVAANAQTLVGLGELDQGQKQLALLLSILCVFFVVATALRASELRAFAVLIVVLATVCAVGTIYEYRSGVNVFYDAAAKLFGGFATVEPPPHPTADSRDEIFGPTQHGLAIATLLTLALPFAVVGLSSSRTWGRRILYGLAVALILAGAVSTQRKTSIIAPAVAVGVLALYRPRQMLRLAPFAAVVVIGIHVIAPAALGGVISQLTGGFSDSGSTIARTSDYEAIQPDLATNPLLGRGFGTIDPTRSDTYRILDNQYLGWAVQIGFLGLAVYLALLAMAMALAHGVIRWGRDDRTREIGLPAMAGFGAFVVANALFDLISFIQVPYLFCFIAGMCSVAATQRVPAAARERIGVATA